MVSNSCRHSSKNNDESTLCKRIFLGAPKEIIHTVIEQRNLQVDSRRLTNEIFKKVVNLCFFKSSTYYNHFINYLKVNMINQIDLLDQKTLLTLIVKYSFRFHEESLIKKSQHDESTAVDQQINIASSIQMKDELSPKVVLQFLTQDIKCTQLLYLPIKYSFDHLNSYGWSEAPITSKQFDKLVIYPSKIKMHAPKFISIDPSELFCINNNCEHSIQYQMTKLDSLDVFTTLNKNLTGFKKATQCDKCSSVLFNFYAVEILLSEYTSYRALSIQNDSHSFFLEPNFLNYDHTHSISSMNLGLFMQAENIFCKEEQNKMYKLINNKIDKINKQAISAHVYCLLRLYQYYSSAPLSSHEIHRQIKRFIEILTSDTLANHDKKYLSMGEQNISIAV